MPWGAAIAAVGAVGSAEINKSGKNSSTSNTANSPAEQQASDLALSQGESIAQRPYTPYTGQTVQGLTSGQQKGIDQSQTGYDAAKTDMSTASSALTGLPQYNTSTLQKYMDPYVSSVLTPQLNQENINYGAQRSALLNSKAGAFGGDRSALAAGQLDLQHNTTIAKDTGDAYSQAYTNAQSAFFNDKQSQISAANDLANVGNDVSKMNSDQIQNLMQAGGVQQALGQAQLNFNYQQFVENRDWSVNNLTPLLNSIAASKGSNMTTTNTPAPGSALGTALGAAATVAGAYFTGGKSTADNNTDSSSGQVPAGSINVDDQAMQQGYLNAGNSSSPDTSSGYSSDFVP